MTVHVIIDFAVNLYFCLRIRSHYNVSYWL